MKLPVALRAALYPLSKIYGRCVSLRKLFYERGWLKARRLNGTVISVGNLTVGGTGKTPMVLWLAEKFLSEKKCVAILSRGYRGTNNSGDEIELLRQRLGNRVLFGVGPDRYASGRRLEAQQSVDVFLLDDGFQHLQLARDLDVLMLDGSRKLKNEWLLPAGTLREPVAACRRADILIVSRKFERPHVQSGDAHKFSIFYANTRLLGFRQFGVEAQIPRSYLSEIGPGPFFAFCGIGNPEAFFTDLQRWHVPVVERRVFRDHHKYSRGNIEQLQRAAREAGATGLVTTEKDAQNLPLLPTDIPIWIAVIDLVFPAESELLAAIDRVLQRRRGAAA
jgi:tetraacyldisaccharide 4'-kinase